MVSPRDSERHFALRDYVGMACSFMAAKVMSAMITHPAHVVQAKKQAGSASSLFGIVQQIFQQSGLRGFYKATSATIGKIFLAECYRGPLMIETPRLIRKCLANTEYADSNLVSKIIATPIISTIDTTLICPLQRMATHQITSNDPKITLFQIARGYFQMDPLRQFYRGYSIMWIQTSKSWGTFYLLYDLNRFITKKVTGEVSYRSLAFSALIGGLVNSVISHLPDTIRVQIQKDTSANTKILPVIRSSGVTGLLAGLSVRFFINTINYGYRSMLLHYWEK